MRLNIFVMLVLALLAAGVAARTHSRAAHYVKVGSGDSAFLKLDLKIKSQEKDPLGIPVSIVRSSNSFPRGWVIIYATDSDKVTNFDVFEGTEGNYVIKKFGH